MYEALTTFIPALVTDNIGEWIIDKENDGTAEHPDFGLKRYEDILKASEIEWVWNR